MSFEVDENIIRQAEREQAEARAELDALRDEIKRLRQGIWDACLILGMDGDGNDSPRHLVYPHLADLIIEEAERMRADYEEALFDD